MNNDIVLGRYIPDIGPFSSITNHQNVIVIIRHIIDQLCWDFKSTT